MSIKNRNVSYKMNNEEKIEERQKYIIHQGLPIAHKILQVLVTVLCWCALLYCYKDIFKDIYNYIVGRTETINFPKDVMENFAAYAVITFIIITAWIFYNKWMFGGRDRRKGFPVPSDEKQSKQYGISVEQLKMMRSSRIIDVDFDEENKINHIMGQKL